MEAELTSLEQKVDHLISLYTAAQNDNRSLRERLAVVEEANRELSDKVGLAGTRLEALLARIPEL
jgi:cell division protein ZapB